MQVSTVMPLYPYLQAPTAESRFLIGPSAIKSQLPFFLTYNLKRRKSTDLLEINLETVFSHLFYLK